MPTKNAGQRRAEAKVSYDAFLATCPTRQMLDRLSDKWVSLVIPALANGARRHGELRRIIAGVSQKMLTQTLRELEQDGLVSRTVTPSVPVRVDYELTDLGRTLLPVLQAVKIWSETHIEQVMAARDRYELVHGS